MSLEIKFTTKDEDLTPIYGSAGAACFDVVSPWAFTLAPGESMKIDMGIALEPPLGYHVKFYPRSGLGTKTFVSLANTTGIIDGDYRGNVFLTLRVPPDGSELVVAKGDRIAQGELCKDTRATFVRVDSLSETARGDGGHGSTGIGSIVPPTTEANAVFAGGIFGEGIARWTGFPKG